MTSPAITDLTAATPAEIDTVLADIWSRIDRERSSQWHYETLVRKGEQGEWFYAQAGRIEENRQQAAKHKAAADAIQVEADPYEAEYIRRGRWSRYFLVQNNNGHVHRGMHCSTCFMTTQYAWLIDLADCDEAAMIEEWGEKACTVCFPDAPANPAYSRPSKRDQAEQAARQAEKAAKAAAKDAKAIVDVDGQPLRTEYGIIRTKVAARNELSGAIGNIAWYGLGHPSGFQDIARKLAAALRANAPEIDVDKVIANALKKARKDGARDIAHAEAIAKTL